MRDHPVRFHRSFPIARRLRLALLCAAGTLVAVVPPGRAQEPAGDAPSADAASAPVSGSPSAGGSRLVPYPVLFYAPETGLGFGAGAVWFFRRRGSRLSSLSPVLFYTTKRQFSISVVLDAWLDDDGWRVLADAGFSRFPAKYWGIGNETPDEAEEDYTPRSAWLRPRLERRIVGSLYAGFRGSVLTRELVETAEDGLLSSGEVPGAAPLDLLSVGLSASFDSRDDVVLPRRGMLHQLSVERYPDWLGADLQYTAWTADLRGYLPVGGLVMAGQLLLQHVHGTAPFDRLPQLGGDRLLRGYYEGRYRDDALLLLQGEARVPVWGRFGAVGFAGIGQVAPSPGELDVAAVHPSGGIGLRYTLSRDEKLNIRVDFALADGSTGLYFNLGEAF